MGGWEGKQVSEAVLSQRQWFFGADMRAYGREVLSEVQVGVDGEVGR